VSGSADATAAEDSFLVIAPNGRDGALTVRLLAQAGIEARVCADLGDGCDRYEREGAAGFLIAQEVLTPCALDRLVALLTSQEIWSDLPVLLFIAAGNAEERSPTLDVLSRGRLDLGIGTGWQREEFVEPGMPFVGRTARLTGIPPQWARPSTVRQDDAQVARAEPKWRPECVPMVPRTQQARAHRESAACFGSHRPTQDRFPAHLPVNTTMAPIRSSCGAFLACLTATAEIGRNRHIDFLGIGEVQVGHAVCKLGFRFWQTKAGVI